MSGSIKIRRQSSQTEELLDELALIGNEETRADAMEATADVITDKIMEAIFKTLYETRSSIYEKQLYLTGKTTEPAIKVIRDCQRVDKKFARLYETFLRTLTNEVSIRLSKHTKYLKLNEESEKWKRLIVVGESVQKYLNSEFNLILDEACKIFVKGSKVDTGKQFQQVLDTITKTTLEAIDYWFKPSWHTSQNFARVKKQRISEIKNKIKERKTVGYVSRETIAKQYSEGSSTYEEQMRILREREKRAEKAYADYMKKQGRRGSKLLYDDNLKF